MRKTNGWAEPDASQQVAPCARRAFFRQVDAFAALKARVIPDLIECTAARRPARVWIPACGTGEETYSLVMLLLEQFLTCNLEPTVRIFATDSDATAISVARAGLYSTQDMTNVPVSRVEEFFSPCGSGQYRVSSLLRERIVFATHELATDPPISRLDLVNCQNVLVSLAPEARARILARFHFALHDGGYLLLGPEESLGAADGLFEPVPGERHLYRRVGARVVAAVSNRGPAAAHRGRPSYVELETSKEELQSLNEELTTVNSQLAATNEELDAAHSDLTNFLGATNISILFLDAGLRIKRFTVAAATLLNLREGDIGRPVGGLTTGLDAQLTSDAQQVIRTRVAAEHIHTVQNRCYLRRIEPYRSGAERIGGVVVSFVDITGQMRADAQLRRFAMLLRDSDDAIMATDFDGRIRAWNRGAERLYGYTERDALRLNMRNLLPHDVLHSTLEVMRRVEAGEIVPSFDTRRLTRDGRKLDVSVNVALLLDAAGKPESLATTERDITARRQAEEETRRLNSLLEQRVAERTTELQHSEEQIRAILDGTAEAVVTIDTLGSIATFNRAAERIFGYTAAEITGKTVAILVPQYERVARYGSRAVVWQSYASPFFGRNHEVSGRRKDGSVFPIQLSVNPVEGRNLLVGVARDMTEHKALQKEIVDVAMLEQRRIGQELHDGTQQELTGLGLLALSLAETLNRGGDTVAGLLAARVASGLEVANQRVRSLARGMVPVPIDREGLMSALTELARQTTEIHGLPCGFECPAPVEIDNDNEATHLYRIAQEAVSNATRHARPSAIWIRLEHVDGRLLLEVHDNGIGLQTPGVPGTGIGLRLMEHRCGMIGGTFSIEPGTDGGTCIACSVARPDHG